LLTVRELPRLALPEYLPGLAQTGEPATPILFKARAIGVACVIAVQGNLVVLGGPQLSAKGRYCKWEDEAGGTTSSSPRHKRPIVARFPCCGDSRIVASFVAAACPQLDQHAGLRRIGPDLGEVRPVPAQLGELRAPDRRQHVDFLPGQAGEQGYDAIRDANGHGAILLLARKDAVIQYDEAELGVRLKAKRED
jgi:hypothetical protein